jgi:N-acetyl-anhydromuramyl-L-alanine amidase AmpD
MSQDIVPGVPLENKPTAAHAGVRPYTRGIVLHATRGGTRARAGETLAATLEREYAANVRYMQNAAHKVSPHFCVGPTKVARMVADDLVAWHAQQHNQTHLGIEIAQPAYQPDFVDFQYDATAEICAHWCWKYGLAPEHRTNDDQNGIIGHDETDQGRRDHKSDPGAKWDWGRFIPMVKARLRELESAEPQYRTVSEPMQAFLKAHPAYGVPSKRTVDEFGDELVYCHGTTAHPHGVVVVWRKWIASQGHDAIRVMSWDKQCLV